MGRVDQNELSHAVIGACIEVHRTLGPGLLESAYEACLAAELHDRTIPFQRQVELPVAYKSVRIDCGYRLDFVIDDRLILELRAIEKLLPIHQAQLLSYLKLSNKRIGLLINFHTAKLTDGIVRLAN